MKHVPAERRLQVCGDINDEAFEKFSNELYELECDSLDPVVVELNSPGGESYAALAFSARIRLSACPITIVVYGRVESAAVMVLASGKTRLMSKEAWVMVHEDSGKVRGEVHEMEREVGQLRKMEDQWAKLLSEKCKGTVAFWSELHRKTTYLSAKECLELGLVDKVI